MSSCQRAAGSITPRIQVGDIARAAGAALQDTCALSWQQRAALRDMQRCRTAALGGHLHRCDRCGYAVPVYNACRNRHCPTCQSLEQHRWLERRRERILPAPYFHVVFTLPAELRPLVLAQPAVMLDMLMRAASQTLLTLAADTKRLGATPAITMVLHTWTRELAFHPHVHAIVSAGGLQLGEQPRWVHTHPRYLFPLKVMAKLFRATFREACLRAIDAAKVRLPPGTQDAVQRALFDTRWVVYAKKPFGGTDHVFRYLGRYTHRVGISNSRLLHADATHVTFATKHGKTCTLTHIEFLRRLLLHVLPRGFHKIRHFGLASPSHIRLGSLELAAALLARQLPAGPTGTKSPRPPQTWVECLLALTGVDVMRCPRCRTGSLLRDPLPRPAPASLDSS